MNFLKPIKNVQTSQHQIFSSSNDLVIEYIQIQFAEPPSFLIRRSDSLDYVTYRTGIIKRHDTFLLQKYISLHYFSKESKLAVRGRARKRQGDEKLIYRPFYQRSDSIFRALRL